MAASNLNPLFNKSACYCLNEDSVCSHVNLFDGEGANPLRSNADEQLLLHLAFNQTVKLVSVTFGVPRSEECPHTVKMFLNKNNLGFDEATGVIFGLSFVPVDSAYQYSFVVLLHFFLYIVQMLLLPKL